MNKSKVYFTDLRAPVGTSQLTKLQRLIRSAGIGEIDMEKKLVAIKLHFGEPGNLTYLRPNYAKAVADVVKELGGVPFLTDCNTLYPGRRKNALEHIESAYENGFSPFSTGCQVIIGDGLRGNDDVEVPVAGGEYVEKAKIGRAIMDADVFISLSHFKGHEMTGFGGAIKNIGMGCGSRAGKKEQHSNGKPVINADACRGCKRCLHECANNGLHFDEATRKMQVVTENCVGCGRCIGVCPTDSVKPVYDESNDIMNCKMAEYTKAVVNGRPAFHISLVMDVSPFCDCHGENDAPIVPDVGMFASFDPVALDQACVDAVNAQPVSRGSLLEEVEHVHHDHFTDVSPDTNWKSCLEHAEKLGLGTREYELIQI